MTDMMGGAEAPDRVKPWTIKGIGPEERNAAIAAADREGMTIGEWLTRAIRTQVQADHQADRAPVVIEEAVSPKADQQADLAVVERMIAVAERIAAANKMPIPKSITRATHALMREQLSAIRSGRTSAGI
jgi:hypothetical protein